MRFANKHQIVSYCKNSKITNERLATTSKESPEKQIRGLGSCCCVLTRRGFLENILWLHKKNNGMRVGTLVHHLHLQKIYKL